MLQGRTITAYEATVSLAPTGGGQREITRGFPLATS